MDFDGFFHNLLLSKHNGEMIITTEQNPNREMSVTEGIEFLTYSPVSEATRDPHVYLG